MSTSARGRKGCIAESDQHAQVVDDIVTATGVPEGAARERFARLSELGLARPRHEPSWWRGGEDT